jgi:hypothetical protein
MKPGNTTTVEQLQKAITKNGFTMKDSLAIVAGTVGTENGKTRLHVSGSNEDLILIPESQASMDASSLNGKSVVVSGTIPEAIKGKAPQAIRYRSMKEEN